MKSRLCWSVVGALIALALSTVVFGAPGAVATQDQPVNAGQDNTATNGTVIRNTTVNVSDCNNFQSRGLTACGATAVVADGTQIGVSASGTSGVDARGGNYGVFATGDVAGVHAYTVTAGGVGVDGDDPNHVGTGVSGNGFTGVSGNGSTGVYGQGTENGVQAKGGTFGVFAEGTEYGVFSKAGRFGIFGQATSSGGVGVAAKASGHGTALQVIGKARFSRSGVADVAGTSGTPKNSVRVTLPITAKSMMTATLQIYVPGVFVVAAAPNMAGGYFTIYLNKKVKTTVGPISWVVVERP